MPTVSTRHHDSSLAAEEEFLAIVCSDEDLVRAEFDAIIAAEWPSLPPDTPDDDAVERSPGTAGRQPRSGQVRLPNPGTSHRYRPVVAATLTSAPRQPQLKTGKEGDGERRESPVTR